MEPIKVVLIDNEEVFREGIAKILTEQPHIQVIYQGGSSKEAIDKTKKMKPDVILVNSQIPEVNVLTAVKEIRELVPEAKVAMIGRPESGDNPTEALKAGARALLSRSISAADLVKSIELISSGRIIVSPVFVEKFLSEIAGGEVEQGVTDAKKEFFTNGKNKAALISTQKSIDQIIGRKTDDGVKDTRAEPEISEREMEVVKLVVQGYSNKEIAQRLLVTENTAKVHVKNILKKLELKNRQQLAAYAVLKDWVSRNTDTVEKDTNQGT